MKIWKTSLSAVLAACFVFAVAGCAEPHEHTVAAWELTQAPTCTQPGVESGVCSECGDTVTRSVDPLGHDMQPGEVLTESTCTVQGSQQYKCSRCTATETRPIDLISHSWKTLRYVSMADCTNDGSRMVQCTVCLKEETQVVPALGHKVDKPIGQTAPTCTEEGKTEGQCVRCKQQVTVTTPALGHDWDSDYTVDMVPTFESAGSRSRHCTRCDAKDQQTEIPKLDADTPILYEMQLKIPGGGLLNMAGVGYEVKDEAGNSLGTGSFKGGTATVPLLPKTYKVTLSGCPEGYTAQSEYTISPSAFRPDGNVACDFSLSASLISTPAASSVRYSVGSVMHDFTAEDAVTGETLTLSEVLQTAKVVILNFFYVNCHYCGLEFPELEALKARYGEDIAIISVNASEKMMEDGSMSAVDTKQAIINLAKTNNYTFHFAEDRKGGAELSWKFSVRATPINYMVNRYGIVYTSVDGYVESGNEIRLQDAIERGMAA